MISVKNLTKCYGPVLAVKGVSFEVGRGEIVGLLGQNGAGKTTVMKIVTGYLEPTEGTVEVGGADVILDRQRVQRQIGYLPENAPTYPEMLVQEYLLLMAELRGIGADKRNAAVIDAVKATGLVDYLVRPIATLSKGFRQRVGLAQAILHKPEVLILDEPTNGLDPVQIVEIRGLIRKLAEKSTVILSTHILPEIEAVCDRVVILIDGELATDKPLSALLATDRIGVSLPASASAVSQTFMKIPGIRGVRHTGQDFSLEGFDQWELECDAGANPSPEVVKAAAAAGLELGRVSPLAPSLEQVFRDLMDAHVTREKQGARKEVAS
jgi:ABC-2 type transport system ATP-binding protein